MVRKEILHRCQIQVQSIKEILTQVVRKEILQRWQILVGGNTYTGGKTAPWASSSPNAAWDDKYKYAHKYVQTNTSMQDINTDISRKKQTTN